MAKLALNMTHSYRSIHTSKKKVIRDLGIRIYRGMKAKADGTARYVHDDDDDEAQI
jgi:hypothetical protein